MKKIILIFIMLSGCLFGQAQILKPVRWGYAAKRTSPTEATLFMKATIEDGWHIYSAYQKEGGPVKTGFTFTTSPSYSLSGTIAEPKPHTTFSKIFGVEVSSFEKSVIFQQKVKLKSKQVTINGKVEFMVCNETQCLPPEEIEFSIPVK